jgi:LysB family phage lysis regulatory protein
MWAYLRLAPYVLIAALAAILLWYRGESIAAQAEAAQARKETAQAVEANKSQDETIKRLTARRIADEALLTELGSAVARINAHTETMRAEITKLERNNEEIRAYLAGTIPDELRRLLNIPNGDAIPRPN